MSKPDIPKDLTLQRVQYEYERGAFGKCIVYGLELIKKQPNNPALLRVVGYAQLTNGQFIKARHNFEKVLRLTPSDLRATLGVAESFKYEGAFERAHAALDEALARKPESTLLLAEKAEICQIEGQNDSAREFAERVLAVEPANLAVLSTLANIVRRKDGQRGDVIDRLRVCVANPSLNTQQRSVAHFSLGQLLDAEGEYDDAFDAFRQANESRPVTFNGDALDHDVNTALECWTHEKIASLPKIDPKNGELPVFIVGMPRSGTSLVEQIVASHPSVYGAGELGLLKNHAMFLQGSVEARFPILTHSANMTKSNMERFARKFLSDLRKLDPKALRITDKMPDNSIRLNIVGMCLPRAKVIHCLRNPIDTCLSCYFQSFGSGVRYSTRLTALVHYYRAYREIMDRWKEILPLAIHEVRYEDLTANQEAESRKLIEAVDLEWDDGCLRYYESGRAIVTASNEQVRQPIYTTSVARWKRYEKHLGPLIDALGDYSQES